MGNGKRTSMIHSQQSLIYMTNSYRKTIIKTNSYEIFLKPPTKNIFPH